ncbi:sugar phosphate isomerase/epimerase family protein [Paenibacillus pasadenensis]|uniref:Xylose isomerase-like TIM barrel domain-containing protein n=1 Tax=Paenibacillus pasadenensis TaxID=217090 RepID=A0A2N5N2N2_9BACL|nr:MULTISPECIES: sugar phosphate isomerase/epimerase [Paenibacillus]PLT44576.1 hypothetical protein B8V81_3007 [Paenibacillus pasadenensis]QGG55072.1 TIM barrel protein [Paenibacillus sp. B01]
MGYGTLAHTVGRLPLRELTGKLAGRGIDFVQLALSKAIADIDTSPGKLSPALANHIAEQFERVGVRIGVLGCYIDPIHPDPEARRREIGRFKEHLRFARDFGAPIVATETASLQTYASRRPDDYEAFGWSVLKETVEELAEEAERWGVTIGLEPVSYHTLSSAAKMERLLGEVPSSTLGVVFDPVNLLTVSLMDDQEAFLDEAFERFGSRIVLAHLKDAAIVGSELRHLPPGQGQFATEPFLARLHAAKPLLDLSLEEVDGDSLDSALAWVRGLQQPR